MQEISHESDFSVNQFDFTNTELNIIDKLSTYATNKADNYIL